MLKKISLLQIILFVCSTCICVLASLSKQVEKIPFIGIVDVGIGVFIFAIYAYFYYKIPKITIQAIAYQKSYSLLCLLLSLNLLLILLYFININFQWYILLIGLGWRLFLLSQTLPYYFHIYLSYKGDKSYN